jgi:hypothetical protein
MTTLITTYPDEAAARRAIDGLRFRGVSGRDIRLMIGSRPRDVSREPVGGFAGPLSPDAPVGTFGGGMVLRRQGAGGFAGDPDRQRQGSFADSDRVTVVSYENGAERITGLRGARRLLRRAGLGDEALDRAVSALHQGRAIVLADRRAGLAAGELGEVSKASTLQGP